jgi:ribosomal-protein-alanine N-acetyltransferase
MQTRRLRLREFSMADAPALFEILADHDAMRWFGSEPLVHLGQAERLIEAFAGWRHLPSPGTRWAIERRSDGALIGSCGLFKWNRAWRNCVVGYELSRNAWGRGFMTEALSAVLAWGFDHMELNRVEAQVHPKNAPSLALLRRLGFSEEGRMREGGYWLGQYHDLLQYSLLRREFRAE